MVLASHAAQVVALSGNNSAEPRGTVTTLSTYMKNDLPGRYLRVVPGFMLKVPGRYPLKALPVALANPPMPIGLMTLKDRMLTPLSHLFIENIRAIAKRMS
jgi:hypothetical protein